MGRRPEGKEPRPSLRTPWEGRGLAMIVSHRFRFIFIKTLKTVGTSLEVFLSEHCGPEDILTPVFPPEPGHVARDHLGLFDPLFALRHAGRNEIPKRRGTLRDLVRRRRFYNHMPALLARDRLPREVWDGYFKFCVEREPVSKSRSFYRMMKDRGQVGDPDELFARRLLPTDWARYSDLGGRPMVDRILRYETLDEDLAEIFAQLGVPFSGRLSQRAKSAATPRQDEVEFSPAQIAAIRQAFAPEIAHLYPEGAARRA